MAQSNRKFTAILLVMVCGCSRTANDGVDLLSSRLDWYPAWERVPVRPQTNATLRALWVQPDGTEGWAIGSSGAMLHLVREQWTSIGLGDANAGWNAIAFDASGEFGVTVGSGGRIATYSVTDRRWKILTDAPTTEDLNGVWVAPDGVEAYAVGNGGTVLRYSGGAWSRMPVNLPRTAHLADVAGEDETVWVRHGGRVVKIGRQNDAEVGRLHDFDASRLWGTLDPLTLWVTGVSYSVNNGDTIFPEDKARYTMRRYRGEAVDSVQRLPFMPRVAYFTKDARFGVVVGNLEVNEKTFVPSAAFINPMGRFHWSTAESPETKAIWLSQDAARGWAVGERGYVARLRQQRHPIRQLTGDFTSGTELTGWYVAQGKLPAGTTLDSIGLVADDKTVRIPSQGFTAELRRDGMGFQLESSRREAAVNALKGRSVKMQLFFSFPGVEPRYPVGWEKSLAFRVGNRGGSLPRWAVELVLSLVGVIVLLLALRYVPRFWEILLDPDARAKLGWSGKLALGIFIRFSAVRAKVLTGYLRKVKERWPPSPLDRLELGLLSGKCPPIQAAVVVDRSVLEQIYTAMQQGTADRVLWLQDTGGQASNLLRHFGALIAETGGVPVYVNVHERGPLREVAARRLAMVEHISKAAAAYLLETGENVYLVDCIIGEYTADALGEFIPDARVGNLVIVASGAPPDLGEVCHVQVTAVPETVSAAAK